VLVEALATEESQKARMEDVLESLNRLFEEQAA